MGAEGRQARVPGHQGTMWKFDVSIVSGKQPEPAVSSSADREWAGELEAVLERDPHMDRAEVQQVFWPDVVDQVLLAVVLVSRE